jgi:hypothetical protein
VHGGLADEDPNLGQCLANSSAAIAAMRSRAISAEYSRAFRFDRPGGVCGASFTLVRFVPEWTDLDRFGARPCAEFRPKFSGTTVPFIDKDKERMSAG